MGWLREARPRRYAGGVVGVSVVPKVRLERSRAWRFALLLVATGCSEGVQTSPMGTFGYPGTPSGDDPNEDPLQTTSVSGADSNSMSGSDGTGEDDSTTDASGGSDDGGTGSGGSGEPAECGNGIFEGDEACDGDDFGGQDCVTFGFEEGMLTCSADCKLITQGCRTCGDGVRAVSEVCDGDDLGEETCASLGFGGGTLSCAADCLSVDTSGCDPLPSCGDGAVNGSEQCDGAALGSATCVSLGFDQGQLGCNAGACTYNTAGCEYLDCAGEGEFCMFDENDPQSNCCPAGVKGNMFGLCNIAFCV